MSLVGMRTLVRTGGGGALLRAVARRLRPYRLRGFADLHPDFAGRTGLELGGPSPVFGPRGSLPVYPLAARIDNVNFGHRTTWEGEIREGDTFVFRPDADPGRQFVAEAGSLPFLADAAYDFVLSSHCLEHLANPLAAMAEWVRVLRPGGCLGLVVPHRDGTFDHRRPVTTLAHLEEDLARGVDEGDMTHLDEILRLHDLSRDPGAGDAASFTARSRDNRANRCLHHHVFDLRLAIALADRAGLAVLAAEAFRPFHAAVVARRPQAGVVPANAAFLAAGAPHFRRSPFPTDRGR
ncbi:MAG: class I SAM-dependent methyltransferase [bacterium]|nr:class I SAM-dependent methyltransferase [bacterium]